MLAILVLLAFLGVAALSAARLALLLIYFQQEEYDGPRFLRWVGANRATDITFSAAAALMAAGMALGVRAEFGFGFILLASAVLAVRDWRRQKTAKKKLNWTPRARRIFTVALILAVVVALLGPAIFAAFPERWRGPCALGAWIVAIQLAPVFLTLAVSLWQPYEDRNNAKFVADARRIFAEVKPKVIGITGSYGKTTTKHFLAHILSSVAPTLATPGSVNTVLGNTRIIRERLTPGTQYFIVEMGAYGPGSIARLCDLTPPHMGLLTAVGWAHYERFKAIDQVFKTKMELADSVKVQGGQTLLSIDSIPADLVATADRSNLIFVSAGDTPLPVDRRLLGSAITREGLEVTLQVEGKPESFKAGVYGGFQAQNMALAIFAALELGIPVEAIRAALRTMPQVQHRLNVTLHGAGGGLLDDAYNSNPEGFREAIRTIDIVADGGKLGRRIVITPGMVELGEIHDAKHREIGEQMQGKVDVALLVRSDRLQSLIEGAKAGPGPAPEIVEVASETEARAWLASHGQANDYVLFENSVPDLYETKLFL